MDKIERANAQAKHAIVAWLVAADQPKSDEQATELIREWNKLPYDKLLVVKNYNQQRRPYSNPTLAWYMDLCIQEAERIKTGKTVKELTGVSSD